MPTVTISWLEGRSDAAKRGIVADITASISKHGGVDPSNVNIIIHDLKKNQFSKGGKLAADQ